jgi:hypothetical protein
VPHHRKREGENVAKKSKGEERRARLERLERERKAAERKRTLTFVGVIGLIAAIIIGATAWSLVRENQRQSEVEGLSLAEFGVATSEAQCGKPQEVSATGSGDHVPEGAIPYDAAPPAAGPHRPNWVQLARPYYTADDRPEVPMLVHNLEHGYTILWYDETIAGDDAARQEVQDLASKFSDDTLDTAFIAAPWTADDGDPFPDGKHVALTHWYADPETREDQKAVTQFCGRLSGEVVETFMADFPQAAAPEGGIAGNL